MKTNAWLLCAGLALASAGTAVAQTDTRKPAPKPPGKMQAVPAKSSGTCAQHECSLTVTATSCETIDVNPDELHLKGQKEYELVWTIPADSKAAFRDAGIVFKAERSTPLKALGARRAQILKSGKEIRIVVAPKEAGRWYYGVQISYSGKACKQLDPVIVNEM